MKEPQCQLGGAGLHSKYTPLFSSDYNLPLSLGGDGHHRKQIYQTPFDSWECPLLKGEIPYGLFGIHFLFSYYHSNYLRGVRYQITNITKWQAVRSSRYLFRIMILDSSWLAALFDEILTQRNLAKKPVADVYNRLVLPKNVAILEKVSIASRGGYFESSMLQFSSSIAVFV